MEAKFGGKRQGFYGPVVSDVKGVGKGSLDWDLNDWKWDGDLFVASQSSSVSADCRSSQLFPLRPGETSGNAGLDCRGRQFLSFRHEYPGNAGLVSGSASHLEDGNVRDGDATRHETLGNTGLVCRSGQFFPIRPEVLGNAGLVAGSSSPLEDAPHGDVRTETLGHAGPDCIGQQLFPFRIEVPGNADLLSGSSCRVEAGNVPTGNFSPAVPGNDGLDGTDQHFDPFGPEIPGSAGFVGGPYSHSEDTNVPHSDVKRELEKRRRDVDVENERLYHEPGTLDLRLGRQESFAMDEDAQGGKKSRVVGSSSNRAVCQVESCRADLSIAKDYHRRHKVCDIHSKASQALVGNVMQRFCQQCSRFHVLQEFDEGKRSCRRRLAGHNRRRRKALPDAGVNSSSVNEGSSSNYLLNSLLRILSNVQSSSSDQTRNQDLLSHLLMNLGGLAGTVAGGNLSGLLQGSQGSVNVETPIGTLEKAPNVNTSQPALTLPSCSTSNAPNVQKPLRISGECTAVVSSLEHNRIATCAAQVGSSSTVPGLPATKLYLSTEGTSGKEKGTAHTRKTRLNNLDLNSVYDGSQDCVDNLERLNSLVNQTTSSHAYPLSIQRDNQKLSAPQTSASSESTSNQSASTSSGEAQNRTDRIVFKLFGKDPKDLPFDLRTKILGWLSNSPTDIEGYIRPGCIILTIYLRLPRPSLEELCCNFQYNLERLLDASDDLFWKTGWVYTRMQHTVAFISNGRIVLDTALPLESHHSHRILSIKPIAVPPSERVQFVLKGVNLRNSTRLLCALEGNYLVEQPCDFFEGDDLLDTQDRIQFINFDCTIPNVSGRGFVEVEDFGLGGSFFPFLVAEQEVCSEIRTLEYAIELADTAHDVQDGTDKIDLKNKAQYFIEEMGWLLHRYELRFRLGDMDPSSSLFSFNRFRWLMEFSMDHDWCAVVKKLLRIFFDGTIDSGEHSSAEVALFDMGLLHKAVRRSSRPMVELLVRFSAEKRCSKQTMQNEKVNTGSATLFRPDALGPGGLTPLHLAASVDGSENVLDALTDDPGLIGIHAWHSGRDGMGLTPNDYASIRGHYAYIHLVQEKIKKKLNGHVLVDIPTTHIDFNIKQNLSNGLKSGRVASFDKEKIDLKTSQKHCSLCQQKMLYCSSRTSLVYRPAVLSLLGIAVICVCVALLFKSSPEVRFVVEPFRWNALKYGPC